MVSFEQTIGSTHAIVQLLCVRLAAPRAHDQLTARAKACDARTLEVLKVDEFTKFCSDGFLNAVLTRLLDPL